jgi:hypothetical protein
MFVFASVAWATSSSLTLSTNPALFPAFRQSVSDYSIRCAQNPVQVSVTAPTGTTVSVDGQLPRTGTFSTSVSVTTGQEFGVVATAGSQTKTWYARCLPVNYPAYTAAVTGHPQAQYFLTIPEVGGIDPGVGLGYLTLFDDNGNPIWWKQEGLNAEFATLLPNGNIAYTGDPPGVNVIRLNGLKVEASQPLSAYWIGMRSKNSQTGIFL